MKYTHPTQIPRSETFSSIEWLDNYVLLKDSRIKGDTYPMAWADNDEIYIGTGDPCWCMYNGQPYDKLDFEDEELKENLKRKHIGLVVERLYGNAKDFEIERINDMECYLGGGGHGAKPTGMICVDGKLYFAVQNLLGWKPPRHGVKSQHGSDATIICSEDYGKTWTPNLDDILYPFYQENFMYKDEFCECWKIPADQRVEINGWKPMFPGNWFGGPSFVQFGKNNEKAIDDYVYAVSADQWDNGSDLRLGRVKKDSILQREKWEFAVIDEKNDVSWTEHLEKSTPVLTIDRHMSTPEMIYLEKEKKYLLLTWALHSDFNSKQGSELTILESDNMWGPFSLVHYEWMWGKMVDCHYCPRVPLKWFNQDTLEGNMMYSGAWSSGFDTYKPYVREFKINKWGRKV